MKFPSKSMITIYSHELGASVKSIREMIGWSQKKLAVEAGTSPASISLLEKGTNTNIGLETLDSIIKALSNQSILNEDHGYNTGNIVLSFE